MFQSYAKVATFSYESPQGTHNNYFCEWVRPAAAPTHKNLVGAAGPQQTCFEDFRIALADVDI